MWVVDRLVEMAMQNTKGMSECTAQALLDALEKSNLKWLNVCYALYNHLPE